jgi:hypothetical protein
LAESACEEGLESTDSRTQDFQSSMAGGEVRKDEEVI